MVTPVVMVILQGLSLHYNGYRQRLLSTQVGDISLAVTKLRQGSFFPDWLKPRRRDDKALYAVVMEATIGGIFTGKVDAMVDASGISKSEVSRICQGLDDDAVTLNSPKQLIRHLAF